MSAFGYGTGDYFGGRVTRTITVTRTLLWSHSIGLILAALSLTVIPSEAIPSDLTAGVFAGVFGMSGLVALYTGLAAGRAAVVAPTAAVIGVLTPVAVGLFLGDRLAPLGWLGVALAIPSIALVSASGEGSRRSGGLWLGVVAGVFFGAYFVALADTSTASGMWPLVGSRSTSVGLLMLFGLLIRRSDLVPVRGRIGLVVATAGVLDLLGNVGFLIASRLSSLVTVSVVSALYPAVTVAAARLFDSQRLSRTQVVGVAGSVVSVALVALGGG